jgi:hypothetical protein
LEIYYYYLKCLFRNFSAIFLHFTIFFMDRYCVHITVLFSQWYFKILYSLSNDKKIARNRQRIETYSSFNYKGFSGGYFTKADLGLVVTAGVSITTPPVVGSSSAGSGTAAAGTAAASGTAAAVAASATARAAASASAASVPGSTGSSCLVPPCLSSQAVV